ncbi:hypothetical protein CASFOL_008718 [Castilleja foliolosa]|uniref:KIB1-4 beta-propeller domain-containing protein n=1 Tax=Castilleja foliolosa TaxID=1961234 RepID=A0ABD3DZS1_9LAMI
MAPSVFSSSLRLIKLISPFKSPNYGRMMSTTTAHGLINNPSPCLMLPPTFEGDNIVYNFYNLAQNKILNFNNDILIPEEDTRIVGSSHGWLALFNERNCDVILTNPITRRHVKLPPRKSDEPKNTRAKLCGLSKVIISCDAEHEDCQAMMINDDSRLAFCRPGRSPTEWTPIGAPHTRNKHPRCYTDLVYSSRHNLFFCVTEDRYGDNMEAWDVASDPPRLRWEYRDLRTSESNIKYDTSLREEDLLLFKNDWYSDSFRCLVFAEQIDQLFFMTRRVVGYEDVYFTAEEPCNDICAYKTDLFNVHKVDWELGGEGGRLSHLDGGSLDGLAMFVGVNHSFTVSATEDNGLKPNSIYFTDDKGTTPRKLFDENYGGHDIGIFDYENKTISSCYYPCNVYKKIMPAPIWFTPTHN